MHQTIQGNQFEEICKPENFFLQIELYSTFLKYHMVIRFVKAFFK